MLNLDSIFVCVCVCESEHLLENHKFSTEQYSTYMLQPQLWKCIYANNWECKMSEKRSDKMQFHHKNFIISIFENKWIRMRKIHMKWICICRALIFISSFATKLQHGTSKTERNRNRQNMPQNLYTFFPSCNSCNYFIVGNRSKVNIHGCMWIVNVRNSTVYTRTDTRTHTITRFKVACKVVYRILRFQM